MPFPIGLSESFFKRSALIRSMIADELSANKIIETLREYGLGYRRQVALADIGVLKAARERWLTIGEIEDTDELFENMFSVPNREMPKKFAYVLRGGFYDPESGMAGERYLTIGSDESRTVEDVRNAVGALKERYAEELDVESYEIVEAYKNE